MFAINLGGEGEIPGVLNQQPPWCNDPIWYFAIAKKTLGQLQAAGVSFVFGRNDALPFSDEAFDVVYTNSVPIDTMTHLGPGVQRNDIERILKRGGIWIRDGVQVYQKP